MGSVECQFEYDDEVFDIRYGWGEVESFEVELIRLGEC